MVSCRRFLFTFIQFDFSFHCQSMSLGPSIRAAATKINDKGYLEIGRVDLPRDWHASWVGTQPKQNSLQFSEPPQNTQNQHFKTLPSTRRDLDKAMPALNSAIEDHCRVVGHGSSTFRRFVGPRVNAVASELTTLAWIFDNPARSKTNWGSRPKQLHNGSR